mmetsp:Transcript_49911/g.93558  ORF Transcript_49911/g.93558 Transcript_49911/m.93558 type:complete len:183 (+) Transcript_49911:66-614(+)
MSGSALSTRLARCIGIAFTSLNLLALLAEAERNEEARDGKALSNFSFDQQAGLNGTDASGLLTTGLKKAARKSRGFVRPKAALDVEEEAWSGPAELSGRAKEISLALDKLSREMNEANTHATDVQAAVQKWVTEAKSTVLSKGTELATAVKTVEEDLATEHQKVSQEVENAGRLSAEGNEVD